MRFKDLAFNIKRFTVVIDDLIENKNFENIKLISVTIILNIGVEKYNIIETNIYP